MDAGRTKLQKFEDLIAWQKARELCKAIYEFTACLPASNDFALRNQIRSAAISTMSNIAEGFGRWHTAEFRQFLNIAMASCVEVKSQLYVALDQSYLTQDQFDRTYSLSSEVERLVGGLRKSLDRK
jgi:four helix bundle protein